MSHISYTPSDFAWTQWTASDIETLSKSCLEEKKMVFAHVKTIAAHERSYENTVYAIEASNHTISPFLNKLELILNVSPSPETRDAAYKAHEELQKKLIDIEYDLGIYQAMKEYTVPRFQLSTAEEKLFRDTLRDYRRMGFDLGEESRKELQNTFKKLSEFETLFGKNINDYQDHITVTRNELEGLTDDYISRLKCDENGNYLISLDYPEYYPFVQNAKNYVKRKELFDKFLKKGGKKNLELLQDILKLRRKIANLLGYNTFADYKTDVRMAKNSENVKKFLNDLVEQLKEGVSNDLAKLLDIKRQETGNKNDILFYYDIPYFINQNKKYHLHLDEEALREYFPLTKVKEGIFFVYQSLFGLTFSQNNTSPKWNGDVQLYEVKDADRRLLGYVFLDLFPRKGKFGHAAVFPIIPGREIAYKSQEYQSPVVALVTNFPKATSDMPSLLSHDEVLTFFHEFGHVMHGILTKSRFQSQSGTSVVRDFVEAPSQMMENWLWNNEILDIVSEHYLRHGEKIPQDTKENLLKTKLHMIAYATCRQLIFAQFDLILHREDVPDPVRLYSDLSQKIVGVSLPPDHLFPAGFGHLMGYDAGYYGYLWSKVYASDMFTRFQKEGLLNSEVGDDFRRSVLAIGGSQDEAELIRNFLGREPNNFAFFKEIGL
jgi:thimet oligopeptidase